MSSVQIGYKINVHQNWFVLLRKLRTGKLEKHEWGAIEPLSEII